MKTEFPLLTSLVLNGEVDASVIDCKLIDGQQATDQYWYDPVEIWHWGHDFGPLAPPYPDMWLEHTAHIPLKEARANKTILGRFDQRIGTRLTCRRLREVLPELRVKNPELLTPIVLSRAEWVYIATVYAERINYGSTQRRLPAWGVLFVDAAGAVVGDNNPTLISPTVAEIWVEEVTSQLWSILKAAFFAVSLMNCRNVTVEPRMTAQRRSKKTRRPGVPSTEYHVIRLPQRKSHGSSNGTGTPKKLHTVRGHFKTYTPDAPLMGKVSGTYYWSNHVRGDANAGEIISSYTLGRN